MGGGKLIPDGSGRCETAAKNSRFIGYAVPVSGVEEARAAIDDVRKHHPGCSHVVYAFIVGGESREISGMSDDGEPKGTAGRPVMDVLKGSGIVDVALIVVRYFGGTKLGTGGLVKAYGECAKKVLEGLKVRRLVKLLDFALEVPYGLHQKVRDIITGAGGEIGEERFEDAVFLKGKIPEGSWKKCGKDIEEVSRGELSL